MHPSWLKHASAAALSAAACFACAESTPVSTTTTTMAPVSPGTGEAAPGVSGGVVTGERAADDITEARCAHEYSCGNIGFGKGWSSYGECTKQMREINRATLAGQSCGYGVDFSALYRCVADTRAEPCGPPIYAAPLASCSSMKLCR